MYKSFWPEKVDHGVLVAPLCYFSLLLVVSVEQCSPTYRLPLKEKQREKHFRWPLVAFKKVKWRTTMKWIAHGWTPLPTFSRPWLVFPRCAGWPTASFPALSISYFFLHLAADGLMQLFPLFQPVNFFFGLALRLIYGLKRLQTNIRSVKCFPSHRKRFTGLF